MKGNAWSSSACYHMQTRNSKMRSFQSSFHLISYEPFVPCAYILCALGWICHYKTICVTKQRLQSEWNAFKKQSVPLYSRPTDNDTVISSTFKMGHRHWCLLESQRFCTQWMYFCNGSSQRSHTSCQTGLCAMKGYYVVMYRLVPSGFLASDRKMFKKQWLWPLFDFLWLSLRMRLIYVPCTQWGWCTHENTMTAQRRRYVGSGRHRDESSCSVCRCCTEQ